MKIHSMKLAQALPNETSLILFSKSSDKRTKSYDIEMTERGYFKVQAVGSDESYMIFAPNIAWIRCVDEVEKKKPGRPAKGE